MNERERERPVEEHKRGKNEGGREGGMLTQERVDEEEEEELADPEIT